MCVHACVCACVCVRVSTLNEGKERVGLGHSSCTIRGEAFTCL